MQFRVAITPSHTICPILGLNSVYYLLIIITWREERCRNELFTCNYYKTMPHLLCIYSNAHLHLPLPQPPLQPLTHSAQFESTIFNRIVVLLV